jgi:hypothetical protein
METVALEDDGVRLRQGFDAWDKDGRLAFRALYLPTIFRRRARYFRVNSTGKIYRVVSPDKTVEVRAVRRSGG